MRVMFGNSSQPASPPYNVWREKNMGQPLGDAQPSASLSQMADVLAVTERTGAQAPIPLFFTAGNGDVVGCIDNGKTYTLQDLLSGKHDQVAERLRAELKRRGVKPKEIR